MPVPIRRWIEVQGFRSNPFEYYEADQEDLLASYFVEPEWFEALRGNPRNPASAVLFAPRGHGKTSQRLQIARLCGEDARNRALVIQINDYKWLPTDLTTLTSRDYLRYIVDEAGRIIWARIEADSACRQRFAASDLDRLRLHALRFWACPPARRLTLPEPTFDAATTQQLARRLRIPATSNHLADLLVETQANYYKTTPDADLQSELLALAQLADFVSLYILIDRTDEDLQTAQRLDIALDRLAPLIADLPVLEHRGYAFKFFLPDGLETLLNERGIGRVGERPKSYPLRWEDDDLKRMLALRLQSYSPLPGRVGRIARINRFQDLCEVGGDADTQLVRAAGCSPRRMIQLAREVLEYHCNKITDAEMKISRALLNEHIPLPIPKIALDHTGFVAFDGQRREDIRLTPLERQVLGALWGRRGEIISKEELARTIYSDNDPNALEALEKVIKRLRKKVEPQPNPTARQFLYIEYIPFMGYRLLHFFE